MRTKVWLETPKGSAFERNTRTCQENIKMDLKETGFEVVDFKFLKDSAPWSQLSLSLNVLDLRPVISSYVKCGLSGSPQYRPTVAERSRAARGRISSRYGSDKGRSSHTVRNRLTQ
jgi:hypothetical protein